MKQGVKPVKVDPLSELTRSRSFGVEAKSVVLSA